MLEYVCTHLMIIDIDDYMTHNDYNGICVNKWRELSKWDGGQYT